MSDYSTLENDKGRYNFLSHQIEAGFFEEDLISEFCQLGEQLQIAENRIKSVLETGVRRQYNNFLGNVVYSDYWVEEDEDYFRDLAETWALDLSKIDRAKKAWAENKRKNGLDNISSGNVEQIHDLIEFCEEFGLDTKEIREMFERVTGSSLDL
jgi:hypothetical protein